MGATYVAVAAEHPMAALAAQSDEIVAAFIEECKKNTTAEADMATMEKAGVPTELTVRHPLTGKLLPVWVANFVLMEYGSGAVMSVPGHDQRDWEFARKYGIDVVQVVEPAGEDPCDLESAAFTDKGRLVNSGEFDGKLSDEAFAAIVEALEAKGSGRSVTNYRLRDWGVTPALLGLSHPGYSLRQLWCAASARSRPACRFAHRGHLRRCVIASAQDGKLP